MLITRNQAPIVNNKDIFCILKLISKIATNIHITQAVRQCVIRTENSVRIYVNSYSRT